MELHKRKVSWPLLSQVPRPVVCGSVYFTLSSDSGLLSTAVLKRFPLDCWANMPAFASQ